MKALGFTINILLTTIFIFTLAVAVQAQHRVFVSGAGDDANPCTRTLPCRNFQRGHNAVASGGEVVALDSAGYGQVTITKSVTITGESVYAGITAISSANGVTIATAGITVNLRSLTIEGLGSGNNGIRATEFTALHIENCIVNAFVNEGLLVSPSAAGTRKAFIKDCLFKNNGSVGVVLDGVASTLAATVEGTRTENNNAGLLTTGTGATVTVRGCLSSGNSGDGFASRIGGVLNIESSIASNNGASGISTSIGATVRVSDSTVTNNTAFGFANSGVISGTFQSRGNNTVRGNNGGGPQTSGTISPLTGT